MNSIETINGTALEMKDIQAVSLEILKKIADLCDKLNLRYSLAWGTLIGAIRHKGFIPWDDDIDIQMPRPDYEKLKQYFTSHPDDVKPLQLFDTDVKDYPYLLSRISNCDYIIETDNEKQCGMGIFVDIYVVDGIANSFDEAWEYASKTCKYPRLIFLATRNRLVLWTTKGLLRKMVKIPMYYYAKLMGKRYFEDKLMSMIDKDSYDKKDYVGCISWCERPRYAVMKRSEFEDVIDLQFEQYKFKGPREYDKYLRQWYGDYMQLPPEKDRIYQHLYKAYRK